MNPRRHTVALALSALLLACTAAGCVRAPITGSYGLVLFGESQMSELGVQAFEEIREQEPESADPHLRTVVQRVVDRLAQNGDENTRAVQWEVVVFESEEMNAFALPGGKVGVYTGILPVAKTEAGLAAILGHEIGHVVARHGAQRMSTGALTEVALVGAAAVLGESGERDLILGALGMGATVGVALPFSRANENEADVIGQIYMARAGYDPAEAIELWKRFRDAKAEGGPPGFLSTHPADTDRIAALTRNLPRARQAYTASAQHGLGESLVPE